MEPLPSTSPTEIHASQHAACPLCVEGALTARHCKLICPACGYIESCEDLFAASDPFPGDHGGNG